MNKFMWFFGGGVEALGGKVATNGKGKGVVFQSRPLASSEGGYRDVVIHITWMTLDMLDAMPCAGSSVINKTVSPACLVFTCCIAPWLVLPPNMLEAKGLVWSRREKVMR